ncbi:alpha/beta hydrolase fold domain-containing protein [Metapseudomonas otitidis]|uniref:alpha/beta hydrolase fold domain-containing protein n=1 Tax=Metapseudomonas otitidis TaxID=319939 RepID=UPI0008E8510A|nr:alpha/beta hydrolase [Pseudomonas otitidis]SFA50824.1 Acetyl esterase/lipase [Pseudomonas otitidis]
MSMTRLLCCLALLLALPLQPACAGLLQDRREARQLEQAGIRVLRDIAYGNDERQRLDVYLPANPGRGPAPVIFMVHGGAWVTGDKDNGSVALNKALRWVPQGVVLVSANYRMLPDTPPLAQADDVARALAHAQQLASGWQANPARFVLMGHSAGAHLVALLDAAPEIAAQQGARPWIGTVALDSAAFDVESIMQAPHMKLYDKAFGTDPATWQAASPTLRLEQPGTPLLAVCSTRRDDACPQARGFASKGRSLGKRVEVMGVDMSHRQINHELGQDNGYTRDVERFLRSLGVLRL